MKKIFSNAFDFIGETAYAFMLFFAIILIFNLAERNLNKPQLITCLIIALGTATFEKIKHKYK